MPVKCLIEYLKRWPEDKIVSFICVDIKERTIYDLKELTVLTDSETPTLCLNIGDPEPFDEEMKEAAEEAERDE